jgi:hypothetical protein
VQQRNSSYFLLPVHVLFIPLLRPDGFTLFPTPRAYPARQEPPGGHMRYEAAWLRLALRPEPPAPQRDPDETIEVSPTVITQPPN